MSAKSVGAKPDYKAEALAARAVDDEQTSIEEEGSHDRWLAAMIAYRAIRHKNEAAERGAVGDGENDAAPQGAGGGHAGPHDPTKIVPAQETSGTPEAVRPASRRAESVGRGSPAPAATPSPSSEADRLRAVVTAARETLRCIETVVGVGYYGGSLHENDFAAAKLRAALAQAAEGEK